MYIVPEPIEVKAIEKYKLYTALYSLYFICICFWLCGPSSLKNI